MIDDANIKKITDKLYMNSRMDMEFFMYLPSGTWATKDRTTVSLNSNPVIYLRYRPPRLYASEFDYRKAAYKITPRNIYYVTKFFNTIVSWFYEDKYRDLFLINEEGNLIFNADYNKLHVTMPKPDGLNQVMQAIPTVVEIGDKLYEGIHLYVNKSAYCISLTFEEITTIFGILRDFRFSEEVAKALAIYQYIVMHDAITAENPLDRKKNPFD